MKPTVAHLLDKIFIHPVSQFFEQCAVYFTVVSMTKLIQRVLQI